jgi:hypothetical protein
MGRSSAQIIARLNDLARPFGINFGSGALSEIVWQSQKRLLLMTRCTSPSGSRRTLRFGFRVIFAG